MKSFSLMLLSILWVTVLTALTQVGGIVWLANRVLFARFFQGKEIRGMVRTASFVGLYLVATVIIVPPIARLFGRVPLPVFKENCVKPVTIWTCLLNRHYVRPELKNALYSVAGKMQDRFPGSEARYLDANLPFINGFPLLPHLSHNDGRKLDVAFYYVNRKSGLQVNEKPAFSGYGVFEGPSANEVNTTDRCFGKGYWQYDFSRFLTFGSDAEKFAFDPARTRAMVEAFSNEPAVEKMFLEPHLQTRLGLEGNNKINFQGCQAVRHDDHLHVQVR